MADLTISAKANADSIPRVEPTIRDLSLVHVGHVPEKVERIAREFTVWAVGLVVRGRGRYRMGPGREYPIGPGSLFTVFPGPEFFYAPDEGTTWDEYHVTFAGPGTQRLIDRGWFFTTGVVERVVGLELLVERFRELKHMFGKSGPGDVDRALLASESLLLELYLSQESRRAAQTPSSSMEKVLGYVHRHFAEPVDFEALAEQNAMSYSHLRQEFRRLTGLGPAHYLTRVRCDRAGMLLRDTSRSIKAIALSVGVPDPYAFSRIFHRTLGVSPREYRQETAMAFPESHRASRVNRAGGAS